MIVPVILCGGAGTRLWPASREDSPKPFLALVDGASTLGLTLARIADSTVYGEPVIVAGAKAGRRTHHQEIREGVGVSSGFRACGRGRAGGTLLLTGCCRRRVLKEKMAKACTLLKVHIHELKFCGLCACVSHKRFCANRIETRTEPQGYQRPGHEVPVAGGETATQTDASNLQ